MSRRLGSVSIIEGSTAFTVIARGFSSSASDSVKRMTPDFDAA